MFLSILFGILGWRITRGTKSTALTVGFMIGAAAMMTQLFFMLAVIFFAIGTEAGNKGIRTS